MKTPEVTHTEVTYSSRGGEAPAGSRLGVRAQGTVGSAADPANRQAPGKESRGYLSTARRFCFTSWKPDFFFFLNQIGLFLFLFF